MDFLSVYCLVYTLFIPLLFNRTGLLLVLLTCPSASSKGVSSLGPPRVSHHLRFLNALRSRSLSSVCHAFGRPLSGFGLGGHMSHSESSLPEYLLIGLHLWYSRQVSLITFISQYGFGLVGFRIWLVVWTSRPDGPTTSQGFRLTLLVAGFHSSQFFLDLFRSIRSLPLCPSAPLSRMLPHSLRITVATALN